MKNTLAMRFAVAESGEVFSGFITRGWTWAGFTVSWKRARRHPPARGWQKYRTEGGFQDLRTADTFLNFEFEFEWKIEPGANSGVKYLIEKVDEWKPKQGPGYNARGRGPEYQIIDDDHNDDSRGNPSKQTASLYGVAAPSAHVAKPAGEFNVSRIVVDHGRVEHWLNGVKVLEYQRPVRESPIVLQNHHSTVWFRNLRVHRLD